MTDIVYKYGPVYPWGCDLWIPYGAQFLRAGVQNESDDNDGNVFLWLLVEPMNPNETWRVEAFPTGTPINNSHQYRYLDTVFFKNGLVFHLFRRFP